MREFDNWLKNRDRDMYEGWKNWAAAGTLGLGAGYLGGHYGSNQQTTPTTQQATATNATQQQAPTPTQTTAYNVNAFGEPVADNGGYAPVNKLGPRGHWYPYNQELPDWNKARENYQKYGKTFLRSHHEPDFWKQFPNG